MQKRIFYTTRERIKLPETRVIHIHLNCVWESWQLRTRYNKKRENLFHFPVLKQALTKNILQCVRFHDLLSNYTIDCFVCYAWLYENIEWMMKNLNVNVTKITVIIECVEACKYMLENGTQLFCCYSHLSTLLLFFVWSLHFSYLKTLCV